ncbi:MAG: hypothetical protein KME12_14825 [Trichocoleus desertorum ATA4-8-CV12]|nr:hypothetical protein [Trichocoleus desertorum ATA4-8-CV12]
MQSKSSRSIKYAAFLALSAVTIAVAYIDSREPQLAWWQSMQSWLKIHVAQSDSENPSTTPITSTPQEKTVESSEQLDTPVGPLSITKYRGDECLYAKATTAHANHYGRLEQLKKPLKDRYQATCVLWH